jgi:electron transport complex protein RnfC
MFRALKVDDKKAQSLVTWAIKKPRLPHSVIVPLQYHEESAAEACVEAGQHVRAGDKIAIAAAKDAVHRHAPISGKIVRVARLPHSLLGEALAIEIYGGEFPEGFISYGPAEFSRQDPLPFFREMGLVDLDSSMQPLHVKISEARRNVPQVLILNGCDPEPYITANHSLAMSHAAELLKGAELLRQAVGARRLVLAFQKNQMEAAEIIRSKIYFLRWEHAEVRIQPSAYPYGLNDLVLWDVLKTNARGVAAVKTQALVLNLATAFAVYEAAEYAKPLIDRTVTLGGECVVEAKNVCVPLGTRMEDAFRFCGGLLRDPGRVLSNGPLKGQAQTALDRPMLPGMAALLALAKEEIDTRDTAACDRCGFCVEACPSDLLPSEIALASVHKDWQGLGARGVESCIECGSCSFVCPSRIPLASLIQTAKEALGPLQKRPSRFTAPQPPAELSVSSSKE